MDQEKTGDGSSAPIEFNDAETTNVAIDLRLILLATFIVGVFNFVLVFISFQQESPFLKNFVRPGAHSVLLYSASVAHIVAILTVISKLPIGKFIYVFQSGNFGAVHAFTVVIALTFINGSLDSIASQSLVDEIMDPFSIFSDLRVINL